MTWHLPHRIEVYKQTCDYLFAAFRVRTLRFAERGRQQNAVTRGLSPRFRPKLPRF